MRTLLLALLIAASGAASMRWGSFVAGGSDSYCYVHQAERWAAVLRDPRGERLQAVEPLAVEAPWPEAARAFAPAGHVPSQAIPGAIAPICPAGLSMAMAPLVAIAGANAAFLILPLFAMVLVAATYAVGARFGTHVGVLGALLTASSPIVLYQSIQPMSDVPAAALWMIAVACALGARPRHVLWAGLATSAAVLVRPNLVPLGFVIGLFLLLRPERTWRQRVRAAVTYAAASAPGCVAVAVIQQAFYGSPFASGYGSMSALFAWQHVGPNTSRYAAWLWDTHTPALALVLLAPFLLAGPLTALFGALFVVNVALYLPYVVFEDWSYLRFLLPTLPLVLILLVATGYAILRRLRVPAASAVVSAAVVLLAIVFVREAEERHTFRLQALEARYERAGRVAAARLPENALVVASRHSGSIRFYARRKTLVWDQLPGGSLAQAIDWARSRGLEPYFVLEGGEEPDFRRHFRGSTLAALDWPPTLTVLPQVNIYRPEDRERYLRGETVPTEYVR